MYRLNYSDILQLMRSAVQLDRIERGDKQPYVGLRRAWELFGRSNVTRWIANGDLPHAKDMQNNRTDGKSTNNRMRLSMVRMTELSLAENLMSNLTVAEPIASGAKKNFFPSGK